MNLRFPSMLRASAVLVLLPLAAWAQQTITAPAGQVGAAYSYQITSNAVPPITYSATGLPAGLGINASSGVISGIPTTAGTATGTVSITSIATGFVNSANLVITIAPASGTPVITSGLTASATVGSVFTYTVTASNSPTSFNVGGLPAGLAADPVAGIITGTPGVAGVSTIALSANNAAGTGATVLLRLTVAAAAGAPVINSAATASGTTSAVFNYQITASNSPTSYSASGDRKSTRLNSSH